MACITIAASPFTLRAETPAIANAVLTSSAAGSGAGATSAATRTTSIVNALAMGATPMPERWLPARGRECGGKGVPRALRRFCAGPRRAPLPFGEAAALALKLGLGEKKTVSIVLREAPMSEWVTAATPDPARAKILAREALARSDAGEPALVWPVDGGKFWRGFGRERGKGARNQGPLLNAKGKRRGRHHDGVDIGAPEGTRVFAVQDGLVIYADNGVRGYGNLLVTVHADGSVAFYAHCRALYVFPGQLIARGQVVGEVGQTGYARGPHVHFEYRAGGRLRDPMKFLAKPRDPGAS